jgi:polyisoprenoid-binding protein YceI
MKNSIIILLFFIINTSFAQIELRTRTGIVNFEASVPYYEEIASTNKTVKAILNLKTGQLSCVVQMKDFRFKLSLMEEHFNKKYLETDDYPQATFKGTIEGFNINIIEHSSKTFKLTGELKMHGKSKMINTIASLKKEGNDLKIVSDFNVSTKDFDIKIPEILSIKVAENVNVSYFFLLKE